MSAPYRDGGDKLRYPLAMLPSLLAAATLAVFHVIPMPTDVNVTPAFQLQGFVSETDHTLLDSPGFDAETERLRPSAKVSFVAPASGLCIVAETETIDGETTYTVNDRIVAQEGERVFRRVVLLTVDDLKGDPWQDSVKRRYRFVVACRKDGNFVWSPFYEIPIDPAASTPT